MPATIAKKRKFLPGKVIREKPNAARLARRTTRTVIIEDVRKLLKNQRSMFPAESTCQKDSMVKPEGGIQVIGTVVVSGSVFSAVSTTQAMGTSHTMAAMIRTAVASQLLSLSARFLPEALERPGTFGVSTAIRPPS